MRIKITILLIVLTLLTTSCNAKEGFTTFGALQDKIDKFLIEIDVSEDEVVVKDIEQSEFGDGVATIYKQIDHIEYIVVNMKKNNIVSKYEIFIVDESLIYVIELATEYNKENNASVLNEVLSEYIILDHEVAIYDTELEVITETRAKNYINDLVEYVMQ